MIELKKELFNLVQSIVQKVLKIERFRVYLRKHNRLVNFGEIQFEFIPYIVFSY